MGWLGEALGYSQVHLASEIKDAPALRAGDNFLLGLATENDLHRELHVATAANAAIYADDGGRTALLPESDVTLAHAFFDGGFEPVVIRFSSGGFALAACFFMDESGTGGFDFFARGGAGFGDLGGFSCCRIQLLHDDELFVIKLAT